MSAIETELRSLQFGFSAVAANGRDPVDDEVVGNMLAAYALVDRWLADGIANDGGLDRVG